MNRNLFAHGKEEGWGAAVLLGQWGLGGGRAAGVWTSGEALAGLGAGELMVVR